jgi:hypothetical protein
MSAGTSTAADFLHCGDFRLRAIGANRCAIAEARLAASGLTARWYPAQRVRASVGIRNAAFMARAKVVSANDGRFGMTDKPTQLGLSSIIRAMSAVSIAASESILSIAMPEVSLRSRCIIWIHSSPHRMWCVPRCLPIAICDSDL